TYIKHEKVASRDFPTEVPCATNSRKRGNIGREEIGTLGFVIVFGPQEVEKFAGLSAGGVDVAISGGGARQRRRDGRAETRRGAERSVAASIGAIRPPAAKVRLAAARRRIRSFGDGEGRV